MTPAKHTPGPCLYCGERHRKPPRYNPGVYCRQEARILRAAIEKSPDSFGIFERAEQEAQP